MSRFHRPIVADTDAEHVCSLARDCYPNRTWCQHAYLSQASPLCERFGGSIDPSKFCEEPICAWPVAVAAAKLVHWINTIERMENSAGGSAAVRSAPLPRAIHYF